MIAVLVFVLAGCGGDGGDKAAVPATSAPGLPFAEAATTPLDPAKAQALQDVLAKIVSRYAANPDDEAASRGVSAAVVTDKWTWSGAAGKDALGTALTPTTSLGVASITKTFVAAEVMLLAKDQKIDLDAPIASYLKNKLTANNATVRQHLAMLSGVPNYLPDDYGRMDKVIKAAPGKHWTPEQALSYDTASVGQPGTYNYSNPSYVLLGMVIEKATGQPLATVLRRDLATPAGLERAAFQDGEKPEPPVAGDKNPVCGPKDDGYLPCRAIASLSAANAGLAADAPTVARWGYELYGGRVIPADLVGQMTKGDGEYGLGTMQFTQRFGIGPAVGHRGEMPDYMSLLVVIPEKRLSIALLFANGNKQIDTAMTDLANALQPLVS
ncbi:CubicO group peptidase (beta-lactamase class C family) [Kribbella antiqua]|uniref:CubicO group peptidase (Beta-lactamase class C family) n=1 Tax=Kribbella antiqua TaxID=2512217 RepID=A0A4R2J5H5_9ACTN|nr:CubicO group peptidase (beta-lactamase class C family) [Kribbella antiqua]